MIFTGDGAVHPGPRSHYNGWDVGTYSGPTFSNAPIKFGYRAVEIHDWRIKEILDPNLSNHETNLSVTYKSGTVARIYQSDGTRVGKNNVFSGYIIQELGEPTCAYLASNYLQIGDWRFGLADTAHFSVSHKDGKTAVIYRIDGTVHPGPRTDFSAWALGEEPAIMGSFIGKRVL